LKQDLSMFEDECFDEHDEEDQYFDEHDEEDQYALWQRAQEIAEANCENELFDKFCEDGFDEADYEDA